MLALLHVLTQASFLELEPPQQIQPLVGPEHCLLHPCLSLRPSSHFSLKSLTPFPQSLLGLQLLLQLS